MPGRPRTTPEELEARIAEYCRKYGVAAGPSGLPPYPSGKRETAQHRDWVGAYKAHRQLVRDRPAAPED